MILGKRKGIAVQIADALRERILDGEFKPGSKLPPIKALAERFGVSLTPVNQAFHKLEEEGLVLCRVGDGTYVTELRPIANPIHFTLCANIGQHITGELAGKIVQCLHHLRIYPVLLDSEHINGDDLLRNALPDSRVILVVGNTNLPLGKLTGQAKKDKTIISVLAWDSHEVEELAGIHTVWVDHAEGGHLAAQHLWAKGCRRVVVLGTSSMVSEENNFPSPSSVWGYSFGQSWREMGGSMRVLAGRAVEGYSDPMISKGELRQLLASEADLGPVGIMGLRDFEAWQAQDVVYAEFPQMNIPIVGYGNTPWSRAARPPISTVDWNMQEIAEIASRVVTAAVTGGLSQVERYVIKPVLLARD